MSNKKENFKSLASKYDLSVPTFMMNIKIIKKKLDACVGRKNYRGLTPRQVLLIIEHLGRWDEEK